MNDDILFFLDSHPDALPLYEALKAALLVRVPHAQIKVAKTQITFADRRGFAFVSFNPCRKKALRPAIWITLTFGLGYRKESPRIDFATEPYPNRWTHHMTVGTAEEIDEELLGWMQEAADFAASKR